VARAQLSQFAAAESNLLEANAIFIKTRGESHADTRAALKRWWTSIPYGQGRAAQRLRRQKRRVENEAGGNCADQPGEEAMSQ